MRATKREVEYLVQRCQLEVESASRVAAGVLKLLQLQGPFGQSAIDQLNDIGEFIDEGDEGGKQNKEQSVNET